MSSVSTIVMYDTSPSSPASNRRESAGRETILDDCNLTKLRKVFDFPLKISSHSANSAMFAQGNTNSPYRSSQPSQGYGTPQQGSSFSQQQTSNFGQSSSGQYNSNANSQASFSGPQFGGGNSQFGGGSAGNGYGSQFGSGGNPQQQGGAYGSPFAQHGMQNSMGAPSNGTPNFGEAKKRNYLPGYLSGGAAAQVRLRVF